MRYPPTSADLPTSLPAINGRPVRDVARGAFPRRGSSARSPRPTALVLDLFGTLVAAPSTVERSIAASRIAEVLRVSPVIVEFALAGSWQARHDGRLRTTVEVAEHLVGRCNASDSCVKGLEQLLARLARARLQADVVLLRALGELRRGGVRLAVLSDASADIAEAWRHSDLAPYFDVVVFSCRAGAVKPELRLFSETLAALRAAPEQVLYCGDGGGDELAGAESAGMRAVRVDRRGGSHCLAFGETAWPGRTIPRVEALPSLLSTWTRR
ncbi:HAD family hydrolase [Streptomyces sp. NPDC088146]|uniref:HAD family hydrolase n=1 Tax=Streptomyces sp. NPDC088146 TaxID=3365829 RepID=UPI00382858C3